MKNCKLNADKKVCDNLEEKQFSFFFLVLWNFRYWIVVVTDSDNCLEQIFYLQTLLKTKKYIYKKKKFNKSFRSSQCGSYLMTILLIQEVKVVFVI